MTAWQGDMIIRLLILIAEILIFMAHNKSVPIATESRWRQLKQFYNGSAHGEIDPYPE